MITDEEHHTSVDAMTEALIDMTGHRDDLIRRLADAEEERDRLRTALTERTAQIDALRTPIDTACVEHVVLNGHIDVAKECRDYLNSEDDPSGKLSDFVEALGIVIAQLDRQRRRANWYQAAYDAGKAKLIESATADLRAALATAAEHRSQNAAIIAAVNDAIGRAGIHCAITFWDAIDQIAKERDEAIAARDACYAEAVEAHAERDAARAEVEQRRTSERLADEDRDYWRDLADRAGRDNVALSKLRATAEAEAIRLRALINTPQTEDFVEAMKVEAAHQVERWGVEHDAGKRPEDWIALVVYLLGKATRAHFERDGAKLLHHVITLAAVALNWHHNMTGESTAMRPGIRRPDEINVSEVFIYRNADGTTSRVTVGHHTPCRGGDACACEPITTSDRFYPKTAVPAEDVAP